MTEPDAQPVIRGAERLLAAGVLLAGAGGAWWGLEGGTCCAAPMAAFAMLLVLATWVDSRRGVEAGPFTREGNGPETQESGDSLD